jgi:hypothetical protein
MSVSNEQLLKDIENTKKEVDAYKKIRDGYLVLSQLPENSIQPNGKYYYAESHSCDILYNECSEFLEKLLNLKKERGI